MTTTQVRWACAASAPPTSERSRNVSLPLIPYLPRLEPPPMLAATPRLHTALLLPAILVGLLLTPAAALTSLPRLSPRRLDVLAPARRLCLQQPRAPSSFFLFPFVPCTTSHSSLRSTSSSGTSISSTSSGTSTSSTTSTSSNSSKAKESSLSPSVLARETLAGCVTALATIPTSVSYATVVGVSPLVGIWSSAITGLFSALVGREPGLITAAAGVIAIPMGKLLRSHGVGYMSACVVLAGVLEYVFGALGLGTKMGLYCEDSCDVFSGSHISPPIIAGFMNAFGLFLLKSQFKFFKSLPPATLLPSLGTALLALLSINLFPLVTKVVPGTLLGLLFASVVSKGWGLGLLTLSQYAGPGVFSGGVSALPTLAGLSSLSSLFSATTAATAATTAATTAGGASVAAAGVGAAVGAAAAGGVGLSGIWRVWEVLKVIALPAIGVATISILETSIAAEIAGNNYANYDQDYTPRGNRAMKGLGVGNIASALLGGFGGCGVIPNTQLNNKSGGRTGVSSLAYSLSLMASVVLMAPLIGSLPLAALGGLMTHVALNSIEWAETGLLLRKFVDRPNSTAAFVELVTMAVTFLLCVTGDMGMGVLVGVATSKTAPIVRFLKTQTGVLFGRIAPRNYSI